MKNYRAKIYWIGGKTEIITLNATTYGGALDELSDMYFSTKGLIAYRII